jgi:hypothetical protein
MGHYDRRIGTRKPFEGFPALVSPVRMNANGDGVRRRRRSAEKHGRLLDVSLSGANLEAPENLGLLVGGLVEVRIDEDRSFVGRIKRLSLCDDERNVRCGVAYHDMSPGCRAWLHEWTLPQSD